jgi:uncharacterized membrane protein
MKRTALSAVLSFVLAAILACATLAQATVTGGPGGGIVPPPPITGYIAIDLDPCLPPVSSNPGSWATGINSYGEIVLHNPNGTYVSWMGFGASQLETPSGTRVYAKRINSDGIAAGNIDYGNQWYGAAWDWNNAISVQTPVKYLADINDRGYAVGTTEDGGARIINVYTGAWRQVSPRYTGSFPTGINNNNVVCGSILAGNTNSPCVWTPDGRCTLLPRPAGITMGGWATDINDNNVVVGGCGPFNGGYRAVAWQNGVVRVLPTLGSECRAEAINNAGQAVGYSSDGLRQYPVVWNGTNRITKLPLLQGSNGGYAYDINNQGWIVGLCSKYGVAHATLWIPLSGRRMPF